MSDYFDNQSNWSWCIQDGKAVIVTHHPPHHANDVYHSHTVDITNVQIGQLDDPGTVNEIMGNAHRAASHVPEAPPNTGGKNSGKNTGNPNPAGKSSAVSKGGNGGGHSGGGHVGHGSGHGGNGSNGGHGGSGGGHGR